MAADEKIVRAHVERTKDFRFAATFPDLEHAAAITTDEAAPLGAGAGPNPAALLAAAVANCLAASLVLCLRKARVEPSAVAADAVAHIARNEKGRLRIDAVDVELSLELDDEDEVGLARCAPLYEDFCIVTESVRRGVAVNVTLNTTARGRA